jgi:rubrerythrin
MLIDLAVMEDGHLRTFEQMRKELAGPEKKEMVFDPDNQAALYLQAMADSRGTEGKIDQTQKLTGKEKTEDILKIAINSEKNSVVFYVGLKDLVPTETGKDKVKEIITEEMGHIAVLNKELAAFA